MLYLDSITKEFSTDWCKLVCGKLFDFWWETVEAEIVFNTSAD